jgi:para-aminobenzoate synthetase component 1
VVLAEPRGTIRHTHSAGGIQGIQEGDLALPGLSDDPLATLQAAADACPGSAARGAPVPFAGGWIGYLSFDLGRVIEPVAATPDGAEVDRSWPLSEWHWCPAALVYGRADGRWFEVGRVAREIHDSVAKGDAAPWAAPSFRLGGLRSRTGRAAFEAAVERTVRYIRAGDLFQANLAHRLSAPFAGSARGLFAAMALEASPWYGAYIESPFETVAGERRVIASVSPELFLQAEPGEAGTRVVTRPIKGTRRGDRPVADLAESGKDLAELNMIIDLMRNDLGRVSRFGSVRVEEARAIERHGAPGRPGVLHGVGTVSGVLRDGVGAADLLAATFPPGSVTGAPKIRAMQVIDELEPVRRGPYCGAIGWIGAAAPGAGGGAPRLALSVAIRTALITGLSRADEGPGGVADGVLDYSVGAGIVADSAAPAEWAETLDKAQPVCRLAARGKSRARAGCRP